MNEIVHEMLKSGRTLIGSLSIAGLMDKFFYGIEILCKKGLHDVIFLLNGFMTELYVSLRAV